MNFLKKYYNMFKFMNPENTNIKLIVIVVLLLFLLFDGVNKFEFSWDLVISLCVFVISMTCHEVAHGYVAYKFGDDTAKSEGRITLNPLKHLDLTGMLLPILLLLSGSKFLVGWAKPVPVNFDRLRPHRLGLFCVAIAGIVVNIIIATICGVSLKMLGTEKIILALTENGDVLATTLLYGYIVNLVLALFNLIPITPLDGGRIVHSLSGNRVRQFYEKIEPYGILIVFAIVYTGLFSGVLSKVLGWALKLLLGLDIPIEIM